MEPSERAPPISDRDTPLDASAHDHGDGRSPGSRVFALRRLPGFRQWPVGARLAAYSCGGSHGMRRERPHRVPIQSPRGTITS